MRIQGVRILPSIHPPSSWQLYMIETCGDPECSDLFRDRMLIRYAVQISPQVDLRRTKRAFDKITQRHDTLRINFVKAKGKWKAQINDAHKTGVQVEEFGNVDNETFESIVNKIASEPISIYSQSLIEVKVLKFGTRGDALVLRVHHAITDGYGLTVFFEEFMKTLLNLPLFSSAMSHVDYIKQWDSVNAQTDKVNNQYWIDKLLPMIPPLKLGRKAKGLEMSPENRRERTIGLQVPISKKSVSTLFELAGEIGTTLYSCVVAAYADVICDTSGSDEVYISMPVARHDNQLDFYVGDHSKLILVRYKQAEKWNLRQQAVQVANCIRDGVSHLPTSAFGPAGQLGRAFAESDVSMITYFARESLPHARIKRSNFGGALMAGQHNEQRVGMWKIKPIPLHPQAHTVSELQMDLTEDAEGHTIDLGADADAFSERELVEFSRSLVKKLTA